jgi:cell division protein FtsL
MSLYKKIIIISLVFNFLLFSSYFLYKKITDKKYRVENNIVKIIKEAEIIDNNQNPN